MLKNCLKYQNIFDFGRKIVKFMWQKQKKTKKFQKNHKIKLFFKKFLSFI